MIVGLEECGEILVFVRYDNNQMDGFWEMSGQSLQNFVKFVQYLVRHGQSSKLGQWPLVRIKLG